MNIYFEDWSAPMFLEKLEHNGLPHGDAIIKVLASQHDPRTYFEQPDLTVVEASHEPFGTDEAFDYPGRATYGGEELEAHLSTLGLLDEGQSAVRALFRFSNSHGFCQAAMAAKAPNNDEAWLIDHPFGDIDGIDIAARNPQRNYGIHLDIFFPDSLRALKEVVDYTDPMHVMDMMAAMRKRRDRQAL